MAAGCPNCGSDVRSYRWAGGEEIVQCGWCGTEISRNPAGGQPAPSGNEKPCLGQTGWWLLNFVAFMAKLRR